MRRLVLLALSVASFAFAAPAAAAPAPAPYPKPGTCVDTAGELGAAVCRKVTAVLAADEKATTDEIAVAVVPTTGGMSIERWATGLFDEWGVGKAGKDNGVLLVIAVQDRRLRLVTGDGMRSRLTDWQASEIVGGTITPLMKAGRTEDAVLAGLDAVRRAIGHRVDDTTALASPGLVIPSPAVDPFASAQEDTTDSGGSLAPLVFLGVAVCVIAGALRYLRSQAGYPSCDSSDDSYRRPRSSYRSFGSSSRSSSSRSSSRSSSSRRSGFGGGRSYGGGASGSW